MLNLKLDSKFIDLLDTPQINYKIIEEETENRVCYPIWTLRKLDTHRFLGNKEDN